MNHPNLWRQYQSLPTDGADRYVSPLQLKGYTYTTAEWDSKKCSRGSYFRLWRPDLMDLSQRKYTDGWSFGRVKFWIRFDLDILGMEMLWAKVEIWTVTGMDDVTEEAIVEVNPNQVFDEAQYLPISCIYGPIVLAPYGLLKSKPKTPGAIALWKTSRKSEEDMLQKLANDKTVEITGSCYALLADNKMNWEEFDREGILQMQMYKRRHIDTYRSWAGRKKRKRRARRYKFDFVISDVGKEFGRERAKLAGYERESFKFLVSAFPAGNAKDKLFGLGVSRRQRQR